MNCAICGQESGNNFCEECGQLIRRIDETYTLKQVSTLCAYILGWKAVDSLRENAATTVAQEYIDAYMEDELAAAKISDLQ